MNSILFTLFCVSLVALGAEEVNTLPQGLTHVGSAYIAKLISSLAIQGLKSGGLWVENVEINREGQIPFAPINLTIPIPKLADPINLQAVRFPLDLNIPDFSSSGFFAICEPQLKGLSEIEGTLGVLLDIDTRVIVLDFSVKVPSLMAESIYATDVYMNFTGGDSILKGSGGFVGGFETFFVEFTAEGKIKERLSLDQLHFDFGFDDVILDIENLELNGEVADLSAIAALIKTIYNLIWVDGTKEAIVESARCSIDYAINDCVILDLMAGVYDCLKMDINPKCFGEERADIVQSMDLFAPTQETETCGATKGPTTPTTTTPTTTTPTTTTPIPPTTRPPTTTRTTSAPGPPPQCSQSGYHNVPETLHNIPPHFVQMGETFLAEAIRSLFIKRLTSGNIKLQSAGRGDQFLMASINLTIPLPSLPDPIDLLPLNIPLELKGEGFYTTGFFNVSDPQINGLSGLQDDLVVGLDLETRAVSVDMTMILPSITADSVYSTDVYMNYTEGTGTSESTILGEGKLSGGFQGFFATFRASGQIQERLSLEKLDFDFCFDDAVLDIENLELNGEVINLDGIAALIKALYNIIWVPGRKSIVEMARCSIDYAINDCVILDLVNGVYDCLKLDANSGCMNPVDPSSPTPSTTSTTTLTSPTPSISSTTTPTSGSSDSSTVSDSSTTSTESSPTSTSTLPTSSEDSGAGGLASLWVAIFTLTAICFLF